MIIGGIIPFSLIDYPPHMSCVVFTQGCNFRCPYCHNPELVTSGATGDRFMPQPFFDFLKERKGKLDAVVITGGEPTLQDGLVEFTEKITLLGYAVKLDTNGTNPSLLDQLIRRHLIQAVAMDIKAPLSRYAHVTGVPYNKQVIDAVVKSIKMIQKADIEYEFRTTVVKDLLHPEDILTIGDLLKGSRRYVLQHFVPSQTHDASFADAVSFEDKELAALKEKLLKKKIEEVIIR